MSALRTAVRIGYAPLLLIGVNGLAVVAIGNDQRIWTLGALILAAIGPSFAAYWIEVGFAILVLDAGVTGFGVGTRSRKAPVGIGGTRWPIADPSREGIPAPSGSAAAAR